MTNVPAHPKQDRELGLGRQRSGGRFVTAYDPDIALQICEAIAEGQTLSAICEEHGGFPHRSTFNRWVINNPELSRAYAAARELSAYAQEDRALDLADELSKQKVPKEQIRAYDVAMNQFRWSATRRNPRVFSEKANMTFTVPIQINTGLDLGHGPQEVIGPEIEDVYQITAVVVEPQGDADNQERMQQNEKALVPPEGQKRGRKPVAPRRGQSPRAPRKSASSRAKSKA